jgi:Caenorhabditis protein of unknown function, DUF268
MLQEIYWLLKHPVYRSLSPRQKISILKKNIELWKRFWDSYKSYKYLASLEKNGFNNQNLLENLFPCLGEDTQETEIEPSYFYQDSWAFERIFNESPSSHVDVGSHHKFVALLSKVLPVTMVDIRPLSLPLETLKFQKGSILDLPYANQSIESLSSLCVVEHIGLGRYGDPLDPQGTEKAIMELKRVIKVEGSLYLSMPLDDQNKTYFNAHRSFSENYALKIFEPFTIVDSKYIHGNEFTDERKSGFCIACYHLKNI